MQFSRVTIHLEDDFTYELPMLMFSEVHPTKLYIDNVNAYVDWVHEIDDAFYTKKYIAPTDVKLYCELEGTKVTFRFVGYTTKPDGETIDFYKERTFDFVIVPMMVDLLD